MKNVNFVALGMAISSILILNSCKHANFQPHADAGNDQTITLPTSEVTLIGSATDRDGNGGVPIPFWTRESGPDAIIKNPDKYTTKVTGLTEGTYIFRLTAVDLGGAEGWDEVVITVKPAVPLTNQPPTAIAGSNQTITLPTSTVTLSGSGTDPEGGSLSYGWSKLSGAAATIDSPAKAQTNITGLLTAGDYVFRLTVTDDKGATATSDVTITVNEAEITDSTNSFVADTTEYVVIYARQTANSIGFHGTIGGVNDPYPELLEFLFLSDTSLPIRNSHKLYNITANTPDFREVMVSYTHLKNSLYYPYICTGTDGAIVDVENKDGKLFIKMPKALAQFNNSPTDTLHVSATVHL